MSIALSCPPSGAPASKIITGLGGYPFTLCNIVKAGRAYHRRRYNLARGRSASQDSIDGEAQVRELAKAEEELELQEYRKSIANKKFIDLTYYQQLGLTPFDVSPDEVGEGHYLLVIWE